MQVSWIVVRGSSQPNYFMPGCCNAARRCHWIGAVIGVIISAQLFIWFLGPAIVRAFEVNEFALGMCGFYAAAFVGGVLGWWAASLYRYLELRCVLARLSAPAPRAFVVGSMAPEDAK